MVQEALFKGGFYQRGYSGSSIPVSSVSKTDSSDVFTIHNGDKKPMRILPW
jgi:hypothetical protein